MRLLVHADSLRDAPRMRTAALGLAARGHDVSWLGAAPAGGDVRAIGGGLALARADADVVLAGGSDGAGAALAAHLARARVLLFDLDPRGAERWGLRERWAATALHTTALIDPAHADAARSGVHGLPIERLALWPDGPPAEHPDPTHADTEILERACERSLRRSRGRAPIAAVFLDRDGTLVVERHYLADPDAIELLSGVPRALRNLRAAGYALVVVSNQSGVGRGIYTLATVHAAMARLRRTLRAAGAEPDAIYFCPHAPEAGCPCRKPGIGLLQRAEEDLVLSLADSVMVGDKRLDAECGRRAGGRGVLVRTGYGREEERAIGELPPESRPDAVADDLAAAAAWIVAHPLAES